MASVTPNGSVQRLEFGNLAAAEARPQGVKVLKPAEGFQRQVSRAVRELKKHDLELEKGPYADVNGAVAGLVSDIGVFASGGDKEKLIRCTGDALTPGKGIGSRRFVYNEDVILMADEPVSAGAILEGAARLCMNEDDPGSPFTILNNPMEPYILATSVLRRLDLDAYPALVPRPDSSYLPVLAVLAPDDPVPLHILSITSHSQFTPQSVLLIGDTAMNGVGHAMLARKKAGHLALEVVEGTLERVRDGEMHPLPSVAPQLREISRLLAACRDAWPGCPFLEDSIAFLNRRLTEAFSFAGTRAVSRSGSGSLPFSLSTEELLAAVQCVAVATAQTYVNAVRKGLEA